MNYETLQIEHRDSVGWIWMNRPDLHNAFDERLIAELTTAFVSLDARSDVRAVVLAGRGKSFSAGADLNWMKRQGAAAYEENLADAKRLGALFQRISLCSKPTLARVHGHALGGGMGLAAACDICVASTRAQFGASEVRLGIIPAVIGPYVIRAIGQRQAYRYFQTAERINAERARELGLVHEVVEHESLDEGLAEILAALLNGGPDALAAAADLIRAIDARPLDENLIADTARRIAALRASPEATEGLSAFLAKRTAAWVPLGSESIDV